MAKIENIAGYILTAAGLIGVLVSFIIQKSEFDPTAFAVAIAAIFMAIMGIAMILGSGPTSAQATKSAQA